MLSSCFPILIFVLGIDCVEIDLLYDEISDGERLYGELVRKEQSYGDCWKAAVSELRSGCRKLTEEVQSRLAMSFAGCFLAQAGSEPCHCDDNVPISECLKNSSDRVFNTYTEFFTHTHSICHYLQHREWQEAASRTILALTETSQLVSKKIDAASKSQSKIIDLQQASLNEQKRLISSGRILKAELQHSRQNARDMYQEFKTVTEEQRFLLFEVFDRLRNLQNFVLGEFTGVYTFIYHVILMILVYVLTSVPRTSAARIWLILLVLLSAASERIFTTFTLQDPTLEGNSQGVDGILSARIWLCRKFMCSLGLVILTITYYCYKDYNVINNQLLQEIQQQNKELLSFMKGLSFYENVFQHHNISQSVCSSNNHSPSLHEIPKQKISTTKDMKMVEATVNMGNIQISHQAFENKENIPLNPVETMAFRGNLKVTSRKKPARPRSSAASKNSPGNLSHENSILSQVESPVSKRYNLRSSRSNSPQLSPYSGY